MVLSLLRAIDDGIPALFYQRRYLVSLRIFMLLLLRYLIFLLRAIVIIDERADDVARKDLGKV